MTAPSPFQVAQSVGNKLGQIPVNQADRTAIDEIMEKASKTKNPADMQQIIGEVVKRVSPDRRKAVLGAVTQKAKELQTQQAKAQRGQQYKEMGFPPELASFPDSVQAAYIKEKMSKEGGMERFNQILGGMGGGGQPTSTGQGGMEPTIVDENLNVETVEGGAPGPSPVNMDQALGEASGKGIQSLSDDTLVAMTSMPGYSEPAKQELRRRQEAEKENRADVRQARQETMKTKEQIVNKADDAEESIRNKKELIKLIKEGNLDDPTVATLLTNLPLRLGERMLSPDSVTYRSALIDEFKDLRNIFKGQTRMKEIDILEDKMAGLWLTDEQKARMLESRIDALQTDIIKRDAAIEVDEKHPNLGLLQFNKKVNELSRKKHEALFNKVVGDQKAILEEAERRKEIPLDSTIPEDLNLMKQILMEAGGDKKKAFELAKKKGYKFK